MSSPAGQVPNALQWLNCHTSMSSQASLALAKLAPRLLARLLQGRVSSLAVAGPPGSGKSTLAGLLTHLLNESGMPTVLLSLDDYYLSRRDREVLARDRHALLRQRGVPGTHDWPLFVQHFDRLRAGKGSGMHLPVFDKSVDDPAPADCWRVVDLEPLCLVVEGWCIGAPGQESTRLDVPVNELERREDPKMEWRTWVNDQLKRYRTDLVSRIDEFWYLDVPAWDLVVDWRWQQEKELDHALLRSRAHTEIFLATFERIVSHMQETCGTWADCRLQADALHRWRVVE